MADTVPTHVPFNLNPAGVQRRTSWPNLVAASHQGWGFDTWGPSWSDWLAYDIRFHGNACGHVTIPIQETLARTAIVLQA